MNKTIVPPIKSQGIKTKLVKWIAENIRETKYDRWVEPFMGTGVVGFNIRAKKTLMCDSNPHLIRFYKGIQSKEITHGKVKQFLTTQETIINLLIWGGKIMILAFMAVLFMWIFGSRKFGCNMTVLKMPSLTN